MKFRTGQIVSTPAALVVCEAANVTPLSLFNRHTSGDWGDLSKGDAELNDDAVESGGRIFSAYILPNSKKVWIITEADRSSTCLLLPEDY